MASKIQTLYENESMTEAIYPRTKVEAISNNDGDMLSTILSNLSGEIESYEKVTTSVGTGIKFPNGLILNYGEVTVGHATRVNRTLPIPCTTAVMITSGTPTQTDYASVALVAVKSTLTTATIWNYSNASANIATRWFVLGY